MAAVLRERLSLHPGQVVTILASAKDTAQMSPAPSRPAEFIIRGILETGGPEDSQVLAAPVQRWAGLKGKIRRIEISALS